MRFVGIVVGMASPTRVRGSAVSKRDPERCIDAKAVEVKDWSTRRKFDKPGFAISESYGIMSSVDLLCTAAH